MYSGVAPDGEQSPSDLHEAENAAGRVETVSFALT